MSFDGYTLGQKISILVDRAIEDGVAARLEKKHEYIERIITMLVDAGRMGRHGNPCIEVDKLLRSRARRLRHLEEIKRVRASNERRKIEMRLMRKKIRRLERELAEKVEDPNRP